MSLTVHRIIEHRNDFAFATVSFYENTFEASVYNNPEVKTLIGKCILAELDYSNIVAWRLIEDYEDGDSGIWADAQNVHLCGRVHNVMEQGAGVLLIDIYLQHGREVITVRSSEVGGARAEIGTGMEILIGELKIYRSRV